MTKKVPVYEVKVCFGESVANRTYDLFSDHNEASECAEDILKMAAEGRGFCALTSISIVKHTEETILHLKARR